MDKRKGYVLLLIHAGRRECLHQRVVRNTIFRKAPTSVVSGYGKRSINLNKVVGLCLVIDKCRRQKLCKRAQKISAAAPLRVMASRYNPCE
jgi:hypothetical protein